MKDRSFPAQGDSKADELDAQEAVEGKAVGERQDRQRGPRR